MYHASTTYIVIRNMGIALGWVYALAWFVSGNTLIGIGSVLNTLCTNVGESAVDSTVQGLFLVRGLGQVLIGPAIANIFAASDSLPKCHFIVNMVFLGLTLLWAFAGGLGGRG